MRKLLFLFLFIVVSSCSKKIQYDCDALQRDNIILKTELMNLTRTHLHIVKEYQIQIWYLKHPGKIPNKNFYGDLH